MQSLIQERMGLRLGLTAVGRLLARLDITPQKPLRRAYERDPARIQKWLDQDYPQLRRRAKRYGAQIYFLDEAGFHSDPVLGRTYGLKGHTPVVATSGQRQSINAMSAVSARGGFWYNVYAGKLNAARFVEFLQDFMKGRRERVMLVVDGHPSHKARKVQACDEVTSGSRVFPVVPASASRACGGRSESRAGHPSREPAGHPDGQD